MSKVGEFFKNALREGVENTKNDVFEDGRKYQFDIDILGFIAAMQDNKITQEKIMDILCSLGISERNIALEAIEDAQQWRKNIKVKSKNGSNKSEAK